MMLHVHVSVQSQNDVGQFCHKRLLVQREFLRFNCDLLHINVLSFIGSQYLYTSKKNSLLEACESCIKAHSLPCLPMMTAASSQHARGLTRRCTSLSRRRGKNPAGKKLHMKRRMNVWLQASQKSHAFSIKRRTKQKRRENEHTWLSRSANVAEPGGTSPQRKGKADSGQKTFAHC